MTRMSAPTRHPSAGQVHRIEIPSRAPLWGQLATMVVLSAVVFWTLVRFALHSARGIVVDQHLMESLGGSAMAWVRIIDVLTTITVTTAAIGLGVCVVVALSRRRWALAGAALVLVAGANLTTQVLKHHVLERIPGAGVNTLPSGHTTVSLSLVLAAVLVAPASWRRMLTPLAGFIATFVAAGTIAGHWHRPSDVLAAQAVCLGWTAIVVALVVLLQQRVVAPAFRGYHLWLALAGSSVVGLVFVAWGVRPSAGDVNLPMAALSLVSVGVATALIIGWISSLADRYLA